MRLEITLDESFLQDYFESIIGNPERLNRINRMGRHILVWSQELMTMWKRLEATDLIRNNAVSRQHFQNLVTMLMQKPTSYRRVKANMSEVQGEPTDDQRVVLGTAYQSAHKIVVGDYPEPLRKVNSALTFVSRDAFSAPKSSVITWEQLKIVLLRADNLIEDFFNVFETSIALEVPEDSESEILASYLAYFYDDVLVIQDDYFVQSGGNEQNFNSYVLPKVDSDCQITLRAGVNDSIRQRGISKKRRYETRTDYKIQVNCIERDSENLHDGYFETSKYRITIPYRLSVFGRNGRNRPCMIHINKK